MESTTTYYQITYQLYHWEEWHRTILPDKSFDTIEEAIIELDKHLPCINPNVMDMHVEKVTTIYERVE